jgi:putative aldouronate transport system permease protein
MKATTVDAGVKRVSILSSNVLKKRLLKNRWLYYMLTPGVLYFLIFKYAPMWGVLIAFQDYSPFNGFWGSDWVGFTHFRTA